MYDPRAMMDEMSTASYYYFCSKEIKVKSVECSNANVEEWQNPDFIRIYDFGDSSPPITIRQNKCEGDTFTHVWPGAVFFGHYMASKEGKALARGKTILELGAGVGLAGISCLVVGGAAKVTLSEVPSALSRGQLVPNVAIARGNRRIHDLQTMSLTMGEHDTIGHAKARDLNVDVVLCSDIFFCKFMQNITSKTLRRLISWNAESSSSQGRTVVWISHVDRYPGSVAEVDSALSSAGFSRTRKVDLSSLERCRALLTQPEYDYLLDVKIWFFEYARTGEGKAVEVSFE